MLRLVIHVHAVNCTLMLVILVLLGNVAATWQGTEYCASSPLMHLWYIACRSASVQYVNPVMPAANALAKSNPGPGVARGTLPPPNPDDPNTLVQGPITWCVLCTTLLPVIVLDLTGTAPVLHYLPKTNKCHHNGDDTSPWNDQACFTVYRLVFQASVCTAGVRAPGSCWPLLSWFADRVKVRFALCLKLCCQGYMKL